MLSISLDSFGLASFQRHNHHHHQDYIHHRPGSLVFHPLNTTSLKVRKSKHLKGRSGPRVGHLFDLNICDYNFYYF